MPNAIDLNAPVDQTFSQIQLEDENLNNNNFGTTVEFSRIVFRENKPVTKLKDIGRSPVMADVLWDFPLSQGLRSLSRRGFYKIIDTPVEKRVSDVSTWCAKVLYCHGPKYNFYFEFMANIGPLINIHGRGFDFGNGSSVEIISGRTVASKAYFFKHMQNKVFYVSHQVPIFDQTYQQNYKQTIWFKFP